jgi:hypothetical protein
MQYSTVYAHICMVCNSSSRLIYFTFALQRHNTENSKQIFPGKELRGYSPNSYIYIHVSSDRSAYSVAGK